MQLRYAYHEATPTDVITGMDVPFLHVNMDEVKFSYDSYNESSRNTLDNLRMGIS